MKILTPVTKKPLLMGAAIIFLTLLVYIPAMQGGFVWDDANHLSYGGSGNWTESLYQIWSSPGYTGQYYPLSYTGFFLQQKLWGNNPFGYHVVNILLHAFCALFLWRILVILKLPGAWAAALVFAVHPVCVESVAWISELKNVLSGFFYFVSAFFLLKFFLKEHDAGDWKLWLLAFVFFSCALFAKTVTATLPAAILIVLWCKKGRVSRSEIYALMPFFIFGLLMGLVTIYMEKNFVGASGDSWDMGIVERFLLAGHALCFYVGKLLYPVDFIFIYPRFNIQATDILQYACPLFWVVLISSLWILKNRISRLPLACVLFFIITLFPALGFFNIYPFRYSYVADHFQYLAGIGIIVLVITVIAKWLKKAPLYLKKAGVFVVFFILCFLSWQTWVLSGQYENEEVLWAAVLKKNPDAWMAHGNLARLLEAQGMAEKAMHHRREVERLAPDLFDAHYNTGAVLLLKGEYRSALESFMKAVRLAPDRALAYQGQGFALMGLGQNKEALYNFSIAAELLPDAAESHYGKGLAYIKLGRFNEAIESLELSVRLFNNPFSGQNRSATGPRLAETHYVLGRLFSALGRPDEAVSHYYKAIKIDSAHPSARVHLKKSLEAVGQ